MVIDPLLPDIYAGDGNVAVETTAAAGLPWIGYGAKISQGNYYTGGDWLRTMWPRIKDVGGDRYGLTWFRIGYHYADFAINAVDQAHYALATVASAGGLSYGDLGIAIDVERGGQRATLTKSLVEDTTSKIAEVFRAELGQPPILYGGELVRSLGITSKMGCPYAWVAQYNHTLEPKIYTEMGYTLAEVLFWQYAGKLDATHVADYLANYPRTTPAGFADINATIFAGGGEAAITALRDTFCVRAV